MKTPKQLLTGPDKASDQELLAILRSPAGWTIQAIEEAMFELRKRKVDTSHIFQPVGQAKFKTADRSNHAQAIAKKKNNDELLAMLARPDDWQPHIIEAATAQLQKRGIRVGTEGTPGTAANKGKPLDVAEIQRIVNRWRRRKSLRNGFLIVFLLNIFVVSHLIFASVGTGSGAGTIIGIIDSTSFLLIVPIVLKLSASHDDVNKLDRTGGLEIVGALIEIFKSGAIDNVEHLTLSVMTRRLRQFKSSDANLLNTVHRDFLNKALNDASKRLILTSERINFYVATLKAFEQVGDLTSMTVVERLAKRRAWTDGHMRIRQAAIECLPMLQANYSNVEANKSLLRASQPQLEGTDILLRPASGGNESTPDQLLRAAQLSEEVNE